MSIQYHQRSTWVPSGSLQTYSADNSFTPLVQSSSLPHSMDTSIRKRSWATHATTAILKNDTIQSKRIKLATTEPFCQVDVSNKSKRPCPDEFPMDTSVDLDRYTTELPMHKRICCRSEPDSTLDDLVESNSPYSIQSKADTRCIDNQENINALSSQWVDKSLAIPACNPPWSLADASFECNIDVDAFCRAQFQPTSKPTSCLSSYEFAVGGGQLVRWQEPLSPGQILAQSSQCTKHHTDAHVANSSDMDNDDPQNELENSIPMEL